MEYSEISSMHVYFKDGTYIFPFSLIIYLFSFSVLSFNLFIHLFSIGQKK